MRGAVIDGHWPNVREKPGGRILETLKPGAPLVVFSRQGRYYHCLTPKHLGYIWSEFVRVDPGGSLRELEAQIAELEGLVRR